MVRVMQRLGGWWRLWVVVSVTLGIFTWVIASSASDVSDYETDMTSAQAQSWVAAAKQKVRVCGLAGVPSVSAELDDYDGLYTGSYYCTSDRQYLLSFIYALLPGAILAALGLTIRWIYRGFRKGSVAQ